jgi:hypothetical protein
MELNEETVGFSNMETPFLYIHNFLNKKDNSGHDEAFFRNSGQFRGILTTLGPESIILILVELS